MPSLSMSGKSVSLALLGSDATSRAMLFLCLCLWNLADCASMDGPTQTQVAQRHAIVTQTQNKRCFHGSVTSLPKCYSDTNITLKNPTVKCAGYKKFMVKCVAI